MIKYTNDRSFIKDILYESWSFYVKDLIKGCHSVLNSGLVIKNKTSFISNYNLTEQNIFVNYFEPKIY